MVIVSGCGKETSNLATINTSPDETQSIKITEDFKDNFNQIKIEGKEMRLPCSYNDFINIGFTDEIEESSEISKGKPIMESLQNDSGKLSVYVGYGGKEQQGYKKDSSVIAIFVSRESVGTLETRFYKGINFQSTEAEVSTVLDLIERTDDDSSLYALKMGQYNYLAVSFEKGEINDIMISNGDTFFK